APMTKPDSSGSISSLSHLCVLSSFGLRQSSFLLSLRLGLDRVRCGGGGTEVGGGHSHSGAGLEELLQFQRGFSAESRHGGNGFEGGQAEALDGAEFAQERRLALLADAGEFIQDALGEFLESKLGVVGVGEAVGFVAHTLEELERAGIRAETEGFGDGRAV